MWWFLIALMVLSGSNYSEVNPMTVEQKAIPSIMYTSAIGPAQEPPYLLPAKLLPQFKPIESVKE